MDTVNVEVKGAFQCEHFLEGLYTVAGYECRDRNSRWAYMRERQAVPAAATNVLNIGGLLDLGCMSSLGYGSKRREAFIGEHNGRDFGLWKGTEMEVGHTWRTDIVLPTSAPACIFLHPDY